MSSIVWSYSKDLLHHAALKIHLVVRKFQGKINFSYFLLKMKNLVSSILCITINGEVPPNNNVDWMSRKQVYKPNSKILSRFG